MFCTRHTLTRPTLPRPVATAGPRSVARLNRASAQSRMSTAAHQEVLNRNAELLNRIAAGDYAGYAAMCDPTLTCFEPEAVGHLVEGMDFHKYYFTMPKPEGAAPAPSHVLNTMSSPHVRLVGDACAVVSYVRLTQKMVGGAPVTVRAEETRVWEKRDGAWVHVHMHRSLPPK